MQNNALESSDTSSWRTLKEDRKFDLRPLAPPVRTLSEVFTPSCVIQVGYPQIDTIRCSVVQIFKQSLHLSKSTLILWN